MFWILCAMLLAVVATAILAPVWRAGRGAVAEPAAAYDLRVYRDQLREVDRDEQRGTVAPEDAARLRAEIGRKVLDADRRLTQDGSTDSAMPARQRRAGRFGPVAAVVLVCAGATVLYLREGVPGAGDLPMSARIAAAERAYDSRPSQPEAEAAAPPRPAPAIDEDYARLIEQLRSAVAAKPDDPQGLMLLATNEARIGNMIDAREAQQQLVDLRGDAASAVELMRLAALMMEAAGGLITPEAEQILARALRADPAEPQSRYLLGLLQLQNGRPDRAFPVWRRLLEESPPDAPWSVPIRENIAGLAWLAGQPEYVPPALPQESGALPGPDADALAAAEGMTDAERGQLVTDMVARLEARLAEQGGSPEEWARLIASLTVIGNTQHAREIWSEAQVRFAAAPEALATVAQAAETAGLTE